MPAASSSSSALDQLRRQLMASQVQHAERTVVSTGLRSLDQLLPQQGLPSGSLVEWISDGPGLRATTLALKCAARFLDRPGALAVVDPWHEFHPTSVGHLGIPLSRLLVVRPEPATDAQQTGGSASVSPRAAAQQSPATSTFRSAASQSHNQRAQTLWAVEQLARCAGVRVLLTWNDRMSATAQRRLQLAVENSGVTVFLIRSSQALRQTSWADLRLHVQSTMADPNVATVASDRKTGQPQLSEERVSGRSRWRLMVRLIRSKNAVQHEGAALLECHDETGDVSEAAELAGAASAATTAG
ncbi:MAG: hypothetical protein RIK87_15735 [Fuerstiella sp.]